MIVNFSWIEEKKIAGFGLVGTISSSDIDELVRQKVAIVVSLIEEAYPKEILADKGISYFHLPIEDMQAPTLATVLKFIDIVKRASVDNKAVAVHCRAGLGRTGTLLASFLVFQGVMPDMAIQRIRSLRPGSIETEGQVKILYEFSSFLRLRSNGLHQTH